MKKLIVPPEIDDEFLVDTAYNMLHEAILNNEFKPGRILSETMLSKQLGISRTPTREALKRLEEQGLIQIVPRKGAFVTDITTEKILEIYQMREALECYAINFVPEYGNPNELEDLLNNVIESKEWIEKGEIDRINQLDIRFHRYIIESSHNQLITKTVDHLLNQILRLRNMTPNLPGRLDEQREEHLATLIALKEGRIVEAREHLRNHIQKVRDTAIQIRLKLWRQVEQ
jgi:DNA-binding GntR family transcriptional regulator